MWGLYLFGDEMTTFLSYSEALEGARFAYQETGLAHEVRLIGNAEVKTDKIQPLFNEVLDEYRKSEIQHIIESARNWDEEEERLMCEIDAYKERLNEILSDNN